MAYEIPGFTRSYEAVADLSESFFKFVKLEGAVLSAIESADDNAVGVLQNKPNRESPSGVFQGGERSAGTVMISGVSRVVAGAAVNAGDLLSIDAQGRVVPAAVGGKVVALAETAASGADKVLSALLVPLGGVAAPSA